MLSASSRGPGAGNGWPWLTGLSSSEEAWDERETEMLLLSPLEGRCGRDLQTDWVQLLNSAPV